jgi:hypothetical protein
MFAALVFQQSHCSPAFCSLLDTSRRGRLLPIYSHCRRLLISSLLAFLIMFFYFFLHLPVLTVSVIKLCLTSSLSFSSLWPSVFPCSSTWVCCGSFSFLQAHAAHHQAVHFLCKCFPSTLRSHSLQSVTPLRVQQALPHHQPALNQLGIGDQLFLLLFTPFHHIITTW